MSKRWTVTCFYYLIDCSAYNAFALLRVANPDLFLKNKLRQRRFYLEELGISLVKPQITNRIEILQQKNFTAIKKNLLNNFLKVDKIFLKSTLNVRSLMKILLSLKGILASILIVLNQKLSTPINVINVFFIIASNIVLLKNQFYVHIVIN